MSYNRKMPDWSIEIYYTIQEMDKMLDECIKKHWENLIKEIKEEKAKKEKIPVIYKELVYV